MVFDTLCSKFVSSGSSTSISIRTMRTSHFLLLCILGVALLTSVFCRNEIGPDDCCFGFYPRRVKRSLVRSYYITDERCPKAGIVLVTQKSRHICVDHNLSWVDNLVRNLEEETF